MTQSIGREFMLKTRYEYLEESAQNRGLPQPPLELDYPPDAPLVVLPDARGLNIPAKDLLEAINARTTVRNYSETPLTLDELSFLLWCTQGVKRVSQRPVTLRTVPSAGARHAFETYLLINRVDGLKPGLYRFLAIEHALLPIDLEQDWAGILTEACEDQEMVRNSAATFFWVAVRERMAWRYGERGYRYLHLDAGHVCQNLYLAAEAIESGVCAIAAFNDEKLCTALGVDGVEMFPVYVGTLGKRKPSGR